MKNSFADMIEEKVAKQAEASNEVAESDTAVVDQVDTEEQVSDIEESTESEEQTAEAQEAINEEQEEETQEEVSDEVRNQLMGKESFKKKIEEAKRKKEEEVKAQEEEQEEANLEAQEETEEEEQEEKPQSFQVGEKTFESIEQVNEYLSTMETEKAEFEKEKEEIKNFVEKVNDPELIEVLKYVSDGYSYRTAMVKAGLDESIFEVEQDDPDAEELVEAKIQRKKEIERRAKEQEELTRNMQRSETILQEFQEESGFDDQTKEQLIQKMSAMVDDSLQGKITKDTLNLFLQGVNYKKDVTKAREQGEIQGRNQKIHIQKKRKRGDGIPDLGSRPIPSEKPKDKTLSKLIAQPARSFTEMIKR